MEKDKAKKKLKKDKKLTKDKSFAEVVKIMANTPPVKNEDLKQRRDK